MILNSTYVTMSDKDTRQRSDEGDARRELMRKGDRVLRGETDEIVIHMRRSSSGRVHVDGFHLDE